MEVRNSLYLFFCIAAIGWLCAVHAAVPSTVLGPASNYVLYTTQNFNLQSVKVEGAVAAGGNANVSYFTVSPIGLAKNISRHDIVAAQNLTLSYGIVEKGSVVAGGEATINCTDLPVGQVVQRLDVTPIDFESTTPFLLATSANLGALRALGKTSKSCGVLKLTGNNVTLNVFNISMSQLVGVSTINLAIPLASKAVINVVNATSFSLNYLTMKIANPANVIWNMRLVTRLTIAGEIKGSILAPLADVVATNGHSFGNIVARTITANNWRFVSGYSCKLAGYASVASIVQVQFNPGKVFAMKYFSVMDLPTSLGGNGTSNNTLQQMTVSANISIAAISLDSGGLRALFVMVIDGLRIISGNQDTQNATNDSEKFLQYNLPIFFYQDIRGKIGDVMFMNNERPDLASLKIAIIRLFAMKFDPEDILEKKRNAQDSSSYVQVVDIGSGKQKVTISRTSLSSSDAMQLDIMETLSEETVLTNGKVTSVSLSTHTQINQKPTISEPVDSSDSNSTGSEWSNAFRNVFDNIQLSSTVSMSVSDLPIRSLSHQESQNYIQQSTNSETLIVVSIHTNETGVAWESDDLRQWKDEQVQGNSTVTARGEVATRNVYARDTEVFKLGDDTFGVFVREKYHNEYDSTTRKRVVRAEVYATLKLFTQAKSLFSVLWEYEYNPALLDPVTKAQLTARALDNHEVYALAFDPITKCATLQNVYLFQKNLQWNPKIMLKVISGVYVELALDVNFGVSIPVTATVCHDGSYSIGVEVRANCKVQGTTSTSVLVVQVGGGVKAQLLDHVFALNSGVNNLVKPAQLCITGTLVGNAVQIDLNIWWRHQTVSTSCTWGGCFKIFGKKICPIPQCQIQIQWSAYKTIYQKQFGIVAAVNKELFKTCNDLDSCYLSAYLSLDEGTGVSVGEAITGITGTIGGMVPPVWVNGKYGKALHFRGGYGYVEIPSSAATDVDLADFTIELWVKRGPQSVGLEVLVDKRVSSPGYKGYHLSLDSGKPVFQIAVGSTYNNWAWNDVIPIDANFHHLVVSVKRTLTIKCFIDGVLLSAVFNPSAFSGSMANTANLRLGSRSFSTSGTPYDLTIDGFALYKTAFDDVQILFNGQPKCA